MVALLSCLLLLVVTADCFVLFEHRAVNVKGGASMYSEGEPGLDRYGRKCMY